jgi:2-phospho-L-lactate/phosphoenolpyruvate guanylyltransferase
VADPLQHWWVVPIKAFDLAKQRLGARLSHHERRDLAEQLAAGVLRAINHWPVLVVCQDDSIADFARHHGAQVIDDPGTGLNAAVHAGAMAACERGAARVTVVHADLPWGADLGTELRVDRLRGQEALLVPDRRGDGSNVLSVPADALDPDFNETPFRYRYGVGSAQRHRDEITRTGLWLHERRIESLSLDIDTPDDLDEWHRRQHLQAKPDDPHNKP